MFNYLKKMMKISSFYKFFPIEKKNLRELRLALDKKARALKARGLILLAEEGLNGTLCGQPNDTELMKSFIEDLFEQSFFWKDSFDKKWGFKRLSVKIKKQIITLKGAVPSNKLSSFEEKEGLSPQEWEAKLKAGGSQILDVRNRYETSLGRFKKALDLNMDNFQELPKKLKATACQPDKETLIYCTGGIRCEKAVGMMKNMGFKKVLYLKGGILNYLKEYPRSQFENECFVFDHRAAVDQDLKASQRYSLCPHCGQAGDLRVSCLQCGRHAVICSVCKKSARHRQTCSKNCAYHLKAGHRAKKRGAGQKLDVHSVYAGDR